MRTTSAAAALVEKHDVVGARIEQLPVPGLTARTGSAVHDERGLAPGVATQLPIDALPAADFQHSLCVWSILHDRYICSGAPIPSRSRPHASTRAVKALRTNRDDLTAGSAFSTGQAS